VFQHLFVFSIFCLDGTLPSINSGSGAGVEPKDQDARPRPLKGSTRAQHYPDPLVIHYDRWGGLGVSFPTLEIKSKEGRERCYWEIRQALCFLQATHRLFEQRAYGRKQGAGKLHICFYGLRD